MRLMVTLALVLVAVGVSGQEQPTADRFYQAIRDDNLDALRVLARELGPNEKDSRGYTPLMVAAAFGSVEAMQVLIASGADVKAVSNSGVTALHGSARDVKMVRLLLDRGADIHARSQLGRTPLLVAASTHGTAETVGLLLQRGADINAADNTGVTPLIAASGNDAAVAKLLLAKGADPRMKATIGQSATALMGAAYTGNADLTRLLLARHVEVDVVSADRTGNVKNGPVLFGNVTALHMATTSGSAEVVRLLLDAGAAVDTPDVRGMSPLMWSVSTDRPEPRVVRLLLDKGADASLRSKAAESTRDWARKFNNPAVLAELKLQPVNVSVKSPLASGGETQLPTSREAVERSLPLLRGASSRMRTDGGCVACHAQPMTAMAAQLASARGWRVERPDAESSQAAATLLAGAQGLLEGREAGGSPDTQLYIAMMMAALNAPPSFATDALVHFLADKQRQEGHWLGIGATRAPMQDGNVSRAAMSIRVLATYGVPARKLEFAKRIERAAAWLARQNPRSTEDRVMQLLGLKWAHTHARAREMRTRELMEAQRPDGGWAQTPYLTSDAYATGEVLYTLNEIGVPITEAVVQRGVGFLVRTQDRDGSWHVKSRAMKIQPYFESGFPHGHDQWISQAATAWATMALSLTAQEQVRVAAASPAR